MCGPKDPKDWLAEAKALLPKEVTDVTVSLLVQGLDLLYQSEREPLAGMLKERIPKHSDPDAYLKVVDAFKAGKSFWPDISPAEFWKLVSLVKSDIATPEWVKELPIEAFLETEPQWEGHNQLIHLVKGNLGMCPGFESEMPESVECLKPSSG